MRRGRADRCRRIPDHAPLAGYRRLHRQAAHSTADPRPQARGQAMIVELSPQDVITAATVGVRRRAYAMSRNLAAYGGVGPEDLFDIDCLGAMAELAVARTLNLFWEPHIGETNGYDVGGCVEVRMRRVPGTGTDLPMRTNDNDDKPYVLVLGYRDGRMDLAGWLYGGVAKARGQWCELRKIWFVAPPYEPIETLIEIYNPGRRSIIA